MPKLPWCLGKRLFDPPGRALIYPFLLL